MLIITCRDGENQPYYLAAIRAGIFHWTELRAEATLFDSEREANSAAGAIDKMTNKKWRTAAKVERI